MLNCAIISLIEWRLISEYETYSQRPHLFKINGFINSLFWKFQHWFMTQATSTCSKSAKTHWIKTQELYITVTILVTLDAICCWAWLIATKPLSV